MVYSRRLTATELTRAETMMAAGTLDFRSIWPIGYKAGGVLLDALAYKAKVGGAVVDATLA
jgi:hypothetical protein